MARPTKKKETTPPPAPEVQEQTAPLQEAEAPQEGHLDPAQFADMDDANLQRLAQDLGLDPTAYESRDALIAAISAVPVIPGPPEAQEDAPEPFTPYQATVAQPLVVVRRGKVPNPKDKPIGTLTRGARVTVTASLRGYAILDNGTYIKERYLERTAT